MVASRHRWIYHITNVNNLDTLIREGVLHCKRAIGERCLDYVDIAYPGIQARRETRRVPVWPHSVLHDYVPFYFANRSPMLYAIHQGQVPDYARGQSEVVNLVSSTVAIANAGLPFVFTDGHAIMELTQFFTDLKDLDRVDWKMVNDKYWKDTDEYPDRKRRKQAEFLVFKQVPLDLITAIGVIDQAMAARVSRIVCAGRWKPQVLVRRSWYY